MTLTTAAAPAVAGRGSERRARSTSRVRARMVSAAWGAALILSAQGAAAVVAASSPPFARVLGVALVATGIAGLAWGAITLSCGRVVVVRTAFAALVASIVGVGAVMAATGGRASMVAGPVAVGLLLVTAALVAADRRRGSAPGSTSVGALLLAAAVVAVVTTPALGAVQDAALLRDDGTVVVVDPHHGH